MAGRTVSHYEILRQLAAGGMGVVYLARDTTLDRLVALKFIAAHLLPSEQVRRRFYHEARTISTLGHAHIATVYEAGEVEGAPFFALEYLAGGTLHERLYRLRSAGLRMSVTEALDIAIPLFEGLAHAHRRSVVHRDIKPANVMFNGEGILKITDFGISKLLDAPASTQTGLRLGTVQYMPPEQAYGQETDRRSDLFSAGAVVYEALAGRAPFAAASETAVVARLIDSAPAAPVTSLRDDVPTQLDALLSRLLRKNPDERFQSAEEVLVELHALRGSAMAAVDMPTASLHTAAAAPPPGLATRRKMVGAGVGIAAAAIVLPAAWWKWRPTGLAGGEKRWLVVLPFRYIGSEHGSGELLCQGLMESLASMLAQTEQFQSLFLVVPPSEVLRQGVTEANGARRLFRAELAITGSVQRLTDQLRLTLNLVNTATEPPHLIGSQTIEQAQDSLNALQDRAIAEAAGLLRLKLAPQARTVLAAGTTPVASAYQNYLEARGLLQRYDKPGNLDAAVTLLNKAIEGDARYALAWAGLSEACHYRYDLTSNPQWLNAARTNALRAIELNDSLPAGHINAGASALLLGWAEEALVDYQNALRLDGSNADALRGLANAYQALHRPTDAERTYLRALALRPNDWLGLTDLGMFFLAQNRAADAEKQFRAAAELVPDNEVVWRNLGAFYIYQGAYAEASAALKRSITIRPTHQACSNLGTALFYQGRYADAARMNERAMSIEPSDYHVAVNLADSYRWAPGEADRAAAAYGNALLLAQRAVEANPRDATALVAAAICQAKLGETRQAAAMLNRALALGADNGEVQFQAAIVHEVAGDEAAAFRALAAAVKSGFAVEQIRREPELSRLRQDARFAALTGGMR
jgi:tetratricopeptide (TPR) repeat protein